MKVKRLDKKQQREVQWEVIVNHDGKRVSFMIRKRMNEKLNKVGCDELHYVCGL